MTMTTTESVTVQQIQRLRDNAGEAGDAEQINLCERALALSRAGTEVLSDDEEAISTCVCAINATEAME